MSHSKWDCKYHLVFIPKGGEIELYGKIRKYLGALFHEFSAQRDCKIVKGYMVQEPVHMSISIPPKFSVAEVVGYLKGESAISVVYWFRGRQRNFNEENLRARGFALSTVGFEEPQICAYIGNQKQFDRNGFDEK